MKNRKNEEMLFSKLREHDISMIIFWSFLDDIQKIEIDTTEHDTKVRTNVIDECIKILNNTKHGRSMEMAEYISEVTKQLKEQKNVCD